MMTVIIQASNIGNDAGPFNLFSQVNGFTEAFETDITKDQLLVGFVSYNVPDGTTIVRVMSNSPECTNYVDKEIDAPPSCPDRTLVFQICNENSLLDDNFDIYLNGVNIGAVDLSQNAQVGSVFIATLTPMIITQPDFVCPLNNMTIYNFDPQLLSNRNTIEMKNTKNNGNGNQGTIQVRNYKNGAGISLIEPCTVTDFTFSGASGLDFSFQFFYSECCNE
tara:strand:- start:11834 stop:12496 length:663 start_codon:yes stop_codon:yes gene_type:complete